MTMRAVYSYSNPDSTTDMNAHFRILFNKGVVSGGLISPVGGTYQVTVAPFTAVSADGMVVENDTNTTLTIPSANGTLYHIVLIAQYNAPSAPTLQLQVVSSTTYETTDTTNLVILGSVQIPGNATVQSSHITYDNKHVTTKVGKLSFKGPLASEGAAPSENNSVGDLYLVLGEPPYFIAYAANKQWVKFTDYSQLAADYEAHVTNAGDYTGADKLIRGKHVTPAMLAALGGSAGSPSADNKYVTTQDTNRTLDGGERQGLTAALGGTLSAENPVVSKNLAVLEERVVSYTAVVGGQDNASVATTINGKAVSIFVGTRGKELPVGGAADGVSTARQFFRVEDSLGKGLVVNGKAVYIKNVTLNGVSFDTSGNETDANGFWLGTGALGVVFNTTIPASQTFFLRYNIKGDMTSLSPANRSVGGGSKYAIPPTGYQNRIESYIETYVMNAQAVTTESLEVTGTALLSDGTGAAPSISFTNDPLTGMFYKGTTLMGSDNNFENYSGLGFSVNGHALLVLGRAHQNIDDESFHVLESDIDENGRPYHKWAITNTSGGDSRNMSFMFGTANYRTDFDAAFGIRTGTYTDNFGDLSEPYVSIQRNAAVESFDGSIKQLSVMNGTANKPGLIFNRTNTGFYAFESNGSQSHYVYDGVGLSIGGSPLVLFGNNEGTTTNLDTGSLLIEKSKDGIRLGTWDTSGGTVTLSIGRSNHSVDWESIIEINPDSVEVNGFLSATVDVAAGRYVTAVESVTTAHVISDVYTANNLGTATAPSYSFTGTYSDYGIFIDSPVGDDELRLGTQLAFAVDGKSHLALGKDTWGPGATTANSAPLTINSFANGIAEFGYHISIPHYQAQRSAEHTIAFGTSTYNSDFSPMLSITAQASAAQGQPPVPSRIVSHVKTSVFTVDFRTTYDEDASAVLVYGRNPATLGMEQLVIDSTLLAKNYAYIQSTGTSTVAALSIGAQNGSAAPDRLSGTVIQDWKRAGELNGTEAPTIALSAATTIAELSEKVNELISLLGSSGQGDIVKLHSLFKYV